MFFLKESSFALSVDLSNGLCVCIFKKKFTSNIKTDEFSQKYNLLVRNIILMFFIYKNNSYP